MQNEVSDRVWKKLEHLPDGKTRLGKVTADDVLALIYEIDNMEDKLINLVDRMDPYDG